MPFPTFVNLNTVSIALFVVAIVALLWRDRANIERYSILFLRRTDKGLHLLDTIAQKAPRFWRVWSDLGIVAGFIGMLLTLGFIAKNVLELFVRPDVTQPAVGALIPTVETVKIGPGYVGIPFWYFIIAFSIVLFAHELMHGVIGRNEGFNIKSVGWMILGIIPGAFVEPEGEEMLPSGEKESVGTHGSKNPWHGGNPRSKLRVFAAGPFANITIAVIFGLLAFAGTQLLFADLGLSYAGVINNTPAQQANLSGALLTVNGTQLDTPDDLFTYMKTVSPNQTLAFHTTTGNYTFTAGQHPDHPERGYIGIAKITVNKHYIPQAEPWASALHFLFRLAVFVALINLGVGMFNLLPIKVLDGGWMLSIALEQHFGESFEQKVMPFVTYGTAALVITVFVFALQRLIF